MDMTTNESLPKSDHAPKGVGGWLLILCIWTTVLLPLFSFAKLHEVDGFQLYFGFGLIVYSIVSGIYLWRGLRVGVILVKTLLIIILSLNFIGMVIVIDNGFQDQAFAVLLNSAVPAIWLVYLFNSRRVRATYYE